MKSPSIQRHNSLRPTQTHERGVTIILVALSLVGILAMAALSIDVVTLYLARLEAQRAADAAALAAARVLSLSGVTGDPGNTAVGSPGVPPWPTICTLATQVAQSVADQSTVAATSSSPATVTFQYNGTAVDCSSPSSSFAVNPQVQVQVQRTGLPTFFARMWNRTSSAVAATATAEAFNPSGSGGLLARVVPVQPRCVKPWVVPNLDSLHPGPVAGPKYCNQGTPPGGCTSLTSLADGRITHQGISLGGTGTTGVIGEEFWLVPDCHGTGPGCSTLDPSPVANNSTSGSPIIPPAKPYLEYLPGQVLTSSLAAPTSGSDACADATSNYAKAITGCDQTTIYQCGVQNGNTVDLRENPRTSGDTTNGVRCLTHQATPSLSSGQDSLDTTTFPFAITAGSDYAVTALRGDLVTSSSSVVSLPIYDNTVAINPTGATNVTVIGFLQVFIRGVDSNGVIDVVVLNMAGCGNASSLTVGTAVTGSSPVPVRLINSP